LEYLLLIIIVNLIGGGLVFWLMNSKKSKTRYPEDLDEEGNLTPSTLLKKVGLSQDNEDNQTGVSQEASKHSDQSNKGVSSQMDEKIDEEIEISLELSEMKEKYNSMESRYRDIKSTLEERELLLKSEIKNRKEFNKVKDDLEKELKEAKDSMEMLQKKFGENRLETESFQRKIKLLEDKVSQKESDVYEKEKELEKIQIKIKECQKEVDTSSKQLTERNLLIKNKDEEIAALAKKIKTIGPVEKTLDELETQDRIEGGLSKTTKDDKNEEGVDPEGENKEEKNEPSDKVVEPDKKEELS